MRGCAIALSLSAWKGGGSGCPVPGGAAAAPALRGSGPCGAERYPLTCSVPSAEERWQRWHCRAVSSRLPPASLGFGGVFQAAQPRLRDGNSRLSCGWGEGGSAVCRGCSWPPGMLESLGMFGKRPSSMAGIPFGCPELLEMLRTICHAGVPLGCSVPPAILRDPSGDARIVPGMFGAPL